MLSMLIAWDAEGNVIATVDYLVVRDADENVLGLADFEAHERAGGKLREIAEKPGAVGSGSWPEWLGAAAHDFRVELRPGPAGGSPRVRALVHAKSGHRRERKAVAEAIAARFAAERATAKAEGRDPRAVDIRDLVGGPTRHLRLDADGRTAPRLSLPPPAFPLFRVEG